MARPVRSIISSFNKLSFEQQKEALSELEAAHELSRTAKRAELEQQLAELDYTGPKKLAIAKSLKKADAANGPKPRRSARKMQRRSSVKAKYRDSKTGETWSGRGRMASWLKAKQDAGENIEKYLLN